MSRDLEECCTCFFIIIALVAMLGAALYQDHVNPNPPPRDRVGELEQRVEALEKRHVEKQ